MSAMRQGEKGPGKMAPPEQENRPPEKAFSKRPTDREFFDWNGEAATRIFNIFDSGERGYFLNHMSMEAVDNGAYLSTYKICAGRFGKGTNEGIATVRREIDKSISHLVIQCKESTLLRLTSVLWEEK